MNLNERERATLERMASTFLGYGSFDRPYWYVGTEPGGENDDILRGKLESWTALGESPLVCNKEHHFGFGYRRWHDPMPPLQSTWRPLMLATQAFKRQYDAGSSQLALKHEQATRFGCDSGDSTLLELGALPARNRGSWPYADMGIPKLRSRNEYVSAYLLPRALRIAAAAREHQPAFVWMYGSRAAYSGYWGTIAGGDFAIDPSGYMYRFTGNTLFFVTDHVTYHRPNIYWVELGESIRSRIERTGSRADRKGSDEF